MADNKELAKRATQIGELLENNKDAIARALPSHLKPERLIRVACTAIFRTPALLECDQRSIINSVVISSQLGLEPDGVNGEAYLVPYNTKLGKIAQLIVGYKGLVKLARMSGEILDLYAEPVYTCDTFEIKQGTERGIKHVPNHDSDQYGKETFLKGCYAVALQKNGTSHFEYMTKSQIEGIRARSKAGDSGPWRSDFIEMGRKTVVRRLCKMLPMSVEMQKAVATQDAVETGMPQSMGGYVDVPFAEVEPEPEIETPVTTVAQEAVKQAEPVTQDTKKLLDDISALCDQLDGPDDRMTRPVFQGYIERVKKARKMADFEWQTWTAPALTDLLSHCQTHIERAKFVKK